ncbi:DUF3903 domain-containing protein [Bacillus thuringiensis]|nr:DUF3903 domain-containing protein [Bacillus thuringiensis]
MISNYVVECVFCEENRKPRQAIVTVPATTQLLAIEKVRAECKRRFGKTVLLQTEIKEKLFLNKRKLTINWSAFLSDHIFT